MKIKCNERCFDDCPFADRPEKCHGGGRLKAYDAKDHILKNESNVGKVKSVPGTGHKACRSRIGRM